MQNNPLKKEIIKCIIAPFVHKLYGTLSDVRIML